MTDDSSWRRRVGSLLLAPIGGLGVLLIGGMARDLWQAVPIADAVARGARFAMLYAIVGFPAGYFVEAVVIVVTGRITPRATEWRRVLAVGARAGAVGLPVFGLVSSGASSIETLGLGAVVGAAMGAASAGVYLAMLRGAKLAA